MPEARPLTYGRFTSWISRQTGRPMATGVAGLAIVIWALTGPFFSFSDTWQLVINTGTTIVTFLMVFVIQNSQMRDTQALQVKLDELIRVTSDAKNELIDLEEMDEEELSRVHAEYSGLAKEARERLQDKATDDVESR